MSKHKESILFKSIIVILAITLLVPSIVKLEHAFKNHEHEVCVKPQKIHFHKLDIDCQFYKFKTSPQIAIAFDYDQDLDIIFFNEISDSQYQFIKDSHNLSFSLRAPPSV